MDPETEESLHCAEWPSCRFHCYFTITAAISSQQLRFVWNIIVILKVPETFSQLLFGWDAENRRVSVRFFIPPRPYSPQSGRDLSDGPRCAAYVSCRHRGLPDQSEACLSSWSMGMAASELPACESEWGRRKLTFTFDHQNITDSLQVNIWANEAFVIRYYAD